MAPGVGGKFLKTGGASLWRSALPQPPPTADGKTLEFTVKKPLYVESTMRAANTTIPPILPPHAQL
jgi:hypothetical protein